MKLKLLIILLAYSFLSYGMEQNIVFKINCNVSKALEHISDFNLINDTINGYHHYHPTSVITEKDITTCKINDDLWIITADNHNDFHEGYIIYKGKSYGNKSFFPCSWTKEQLKNELPNIVQIDVEIPKRYTLETRFEYTYEYAPEGKQPVNIGINCHPKINKSFIKTIYPKISKYKKIRKVHLEQIALDQEKQIKKQLLEIPHKIVLKEIIKSEIEKAVEKNDLEKIYDELLDIQTADEFLIQAIRYNNPIITDFALCKGAKASLDILNNKVLNKPIKLEERAQIVRLFLQSGIHIDAETLKLGLKTKSEAILEELIFYYFYNLKQDEIPQTAHTDELCKKIIEKYDNKITKLQENNFKAPIFQAILFNNYNKIVELIENTKLSDLKKALKAAKNNLEIGQMIQIKIDEIKEEEQLKIEEQKEKEKKEENENRKKIFAALANATTNDSANEEELEIIRNNKNFIVFSNKPILEALILNMIEGKTQLIKQLIEDVKCEITEQVFLAAWKKGIINLLFQHTNVGSFLIDWIKTDEGFNRFIEFIKKYPEYLEEIIKSKDFKLAHFKDLVTKLDLDINKLVILATKIDRSDIVEYLLKNGAKHEDALKIAKKGTSSFDLLNEKELEKQKQEQNALLAQKQKLIQEEQEKADIHAQEMGWTPLMRAIIEGKPDQEIISLINNPETDLGSVDINGHDAQYYAEQNKRETIADKIYYKINSGNWSEYQKAAYNKDKNEFKRLIKKNQPIVIFDIEITPELENINLYMHLCNPKTIYKEKIDKLVEILDIKTFLADALMQNKDIENANIILRQFDKISSFLIETNLTEEQRILMLFSIIQKDLMVYKYKSASNGSELIEQTVKFLNIIRHSPSPYADKFKNKCKLELANIYYYNPDLLEGSTETKKSEIINLIMETIDNNANIISPETTLGDYLLANIMLDLQEIDKAKILFEKTLKNKAHLSPEYVAIAEYKLACIYQDTGINTEQTTTTFESLINNDNLPKHILESIIHRLNGIYLQQNNNVKLMELYTKLLHKDVSDQINNSSLVILGKLHNHEGNFKDASYYYKKYVQHSLTKEIDKIEVYFHLANAFYMTKQFKQAALYINKYLQQNFEDNAENITKKIDMQIKLASICSKIDSNINEASLVDFNKAFDLCMQSLINETKLSLNERNAKSLTDMFNEKLRDKILIKILSSEFENINLEQLKINIEELLKPEYTNFINDKIVKLAKEKLQFLSSPEWSKALDLYAQLNDPNKLINSAINLSNSLQSEQQLDTISSSSNSEQKLELEQTDGLTNQEIIEFDEQLIHESKSGNFSSLFELYSDKAKQAENATLIERNKIDQYLKMILMAVQNCIDNNSGNEKFYDILIHYAEKIFRNNYYSQNIINFIITLLEDNLIKNISDDIRLYIYYQLSGLYLYKNSNIEKAIQCFKMTKKLKCTQTKRVIDIQKNLEKFEATILFDK